MKEIIDPYGFIYISTDITNGMRYIGQRIFDNKNVWKNYLGSGTRFKRAIKSHGKENFIRNIVAIAYNQTELNELEIKFINNYNATQSDDYYNISTGGEGGNTYAGKTPKEINEAIKKRSKSLKGHIISQETKYKISESHKGRILSKEHKINIGRSIRGIMAGKNHPMYGKFNELNPNSRKIICLTTGEIFGAIAEAVKKYNINQSSLSKCSIGKRKSAGKNPITGEPLRWMYYKDYISTLV